MHILLGIIFLTIAAIMNACMGNPDDLIALLTVIFCIIGGVGILALLAYGGAIGVFLIIAIVTIFALFCNNK